MMNVNGASFLRRAVGLIALAATILNGAGGVCAQELKTFLNPNPPAGAIWLDSLDLSRINQEFGTPGIGRPVMGLPIKLNGQVYLHGVGSHAVSTIELILSGSALRFASMVGLDDEVTTKGHVTFEIWVDGVKKADSGLLRGGDAAKLMKAELKGAHKMKLLITDGGTGDNSWCHADWAGAYLDLAPGAATRPKAIMIAEEPTMAIASCAPPAEPAIHGPRLVGATSGKPFLYRIPATGEGPLRFTAQNLPQGLKLDATSGILSGSLQKEGTTRVKLTVRGPQGQARRALKIVGGRNQLALTPIMGWNSWYTANTGVTAADIREAADGLITSGLAAHGYQYINIDDAWEGGRDAAGRIHPNEKFGEMKPLVNYIHARGLKFGLYSSPGPQTCGGYEGSYHHEARDVESYAEWGVDLLKYDWCSYGSLAPNNSVVECQRPYRLMGDLLDGCGRDIVFSLCQYGMGDVWKWGTRVRGNLWRTTMDMTSSWSRMSSLGFDQNGPLGKYAGPGHWNDPDMLIVGKIGRGPNPAPVRLRPNEQITYMTLWCMMSAPLIVSCRLDQMDSFTLALLTNDEVLDVNQDPLGTAASRVFKKDDLEIWSRPLWDGTQAVALFNRNLEKRPLTLAWAALGLHGAQPVRDLWRRKDMGKIKDALTVTVPAHGAMLFKIGKPRESE